MLELTMAAVSAADEGATAGMLMADAPSEPGAVLRVGRDKQVCRLSTPDDWLFVSRVHLEFLCGPDGGWQVSWLRGSQPDPSSEVRLTVGSTPSRSRTAAPCRCRGAAAARSSSTTAPPPAASTSASTTRPESGRGYASTRASAKPS